MISTDELKTHSAHPSDQKANHGGKAKPIHLRTTNRDHGIHFPLRLLPGLRSIRLRGLSGSSADLEALVVTSDPMIFLDSRFLFTNRQRIQGNAEAAHHCVEMPKR